MNTNFIKIKDELYISKEHIVAIRSDEDNKQFTRVHTCDGCAFLVRKPIEEVLELINQPNPWLDQKLTYSA